MTDQKDLKFQNILLEDFHTKIQHLMNNIFVCCNAVTKPKYFKTFLAKIITYSTSLTINAVFIKHFKSSNNLARSEYLKVKTFL